MREMPSIVPSSGTPGAGLPHRNNGFRDGPAFLETELDRADLETIITNLMVGEYSDPLRVVMLNPETERC